MKYKNRNIKVYFFSATAESEARLAGVGEQPAGSTLLYDGPRGKLRSVGEGLIDKAPLFENRAAIERQGEILIEVFNKLESGVIE